MKRFFVNIFKRLFFFVAIFFVRAYQLILSPILGGACRFEPSCSQYAVSVLRKHSPVGAIFLIGKRLSKCHPWGSFGYDPVPELPISRERSFGS